MAPRISGRPALPGRWQSSHSRRQTRGQVGIHGCGCANFAPRTQAAAFCKASSHWCTPHRHLTASRAVADIAFVEQIFRMRQIVTLTFGIWMLGHGQPAAASPRLSNEDRAAICAVSEVAFSTFNAIDANADRESADRIGRLGEQADAYKQLPRTLRCGRRWIRLTPRGYGIYMTAFLLSADRREMVISGGYQAGYLDGADGSCLFRYIGSEWQAVGCEITGVS